eukprot:100324-Prorocentrum_minimum.AAC.1
MGWSGICSAAAASSSSGHRSSSAAGSSPSGNIRRPSRTVTQLQQIPHRGQQQLQRAHRLRGGQPLPTAGRDSWHPLARQPDQRPPRLRQAGAAPRVPRQHPHRRRREQRRAGRQLDRDRIGQGTLAGTFFPRSPAPGVDPAAVQALLLLLLHLQNASVAVAPAPIRVDLRFDPAHLLLLAVQALQRPPDRNLLLRPKLIPRLRVDS